MCLVAGRRTNAAWYVARGAPNDRYCGRSRASPCGDISHVIQNVDRNATIYIEPNTKLYPLCATEGAGVIYKSIKLIGMGGLARIGCDSDVKDGAIISQGAYHHGFSLVLENLVLINGAITLSNGTVDIINVYFDGAFITTGTLDCHDLNIDIRNSRWTGYSSCSSETGECIGTAGNNIVCRSTYVRMAQSNFNNSQLHISGSNTLEVSVSDTFFTGSSAEHTDSVKLVFGSQGFCHIERSTFKYQHSRSLVQYAMALYNAALILRTTTSGKGNVTVLLESLEFSHNERALTVIGAHKEVNITNCMFRDNVAMYGGPAILDLTSKDTHLNVVNSSFLGNKAGSIPSTFAVQLPQSVAKVDKGVVYLNANCCKGQVESTGRGGAIRVQRGNMTISDGVFEDNEATAQGGSIMIDQGSRVTLRDTVFTTSGGKPRMGTVLYSRGMLIIDNVTILAKSVERHSSVVEHHGDRWSIRLSTIYIGCPAGSNLLKKEMTSYSVSSIGLGMATEMYDSVVYKCEPCPLGYYNLDSGYLKDFRIYQKWLYYSVVIGNETKVPTQPPSSGIYNHHEVQCEPCPEYCENEHHGNTEEDMCNGETGNGEGNKCNPGGNQHHDNGLHSNHHDDPFEGQCGFCRSTGSDNSNALNLTVLAFLIVMGFQLGLK